MIESVSFEKTVFEKLPFKFEAGTPDYVATHGLAKAIDYIESIGIDKIAKHEQMLTRYCMQQLKTIDGMAIFGEAEHKDAVVSFLVGQIHHLDMGTLLDRLGIAVRTGHHCAQREVWFNGKNLVEMKPEDRAHEGLFLSFQYPVEIPGVSMTNFMRAAINEKRKFQGLNPLNASDFIKLMREKRKIVELDSKLSNRSVNEGFSGGEKKRNEIFQMAMLEPKLAILDETDSGLDVDAMRIVAEGVNKLRTSENSRIVITHYERLRYH